MNMNNIKYLSVAISFIICGLLFLKIYKKKLLLLSEDDNVFIKKNKILKVCAIILIVLGFFCSLVCFIPDELEWSKQNESLYFTKDKNDIVNIINFDNKNVDFPDFINYEEKVLTQKGFNIEEVTLTKKERRKITFFVNSFKKHNELSNSFVILIFSDRKEFINQNIYLGQADEKGVRFYDSYINGVLEKGSTIQNN